MRQLRKNIASNYGRLLLTILLNAVTIPIVARRLGLVQFGLWSLSASIQAYFVLADLGLSAASARFLAEAYASDDQPALQAAASASTAIFRMLSIGALLVGVAMSFVPPSLLHVPPPEAGEFRVIAACIGAMASIGFLGTLSTQAVIAVRRVDILNYAGGVIQLAGAILSLVLVLLTGSAVALVMVQLLSTAANTGAAMGLARKFLPEIHFRARWDWAMVKKLAGFSGAVLVVSGASTIILSSDAVVLGTLSSLASVAIFAVAGRAAQLLRGIVGAGVSALAPFAVADHALGDVEAQRRMWFTSTRLAVILLVPPVLVVLGMGSDLVAIWAGERYRVAGPVLSILAVGFLADLVQSGAYQIGMSSNRHHQVAVVFGVDAAFNLLLSVLLVPSLGPLGAAIGTTIPMATVGLLVLPYLTGRALQVGAMTYLRAVAPALLVVLPLVPAIALYRALPGVHPLLRGLLAYGPPALLVLALIYRFRTSVLGDPQAPAAAP